MINLNLNIHSRNFLNEFRTKDRESGGQGEMRNWKVFAGKKTYEPLSKTKDLGGTNIGRAMRS